MKKWVGIMLLPVLLSGCATAEVFETVGDALLQPVLAEVGEIFLDMPEGSFVQSMVTGGDDKLYFCDGYTAAVQVLDRGDLDQTCKTLCGYGREELNILELSENGQNRYDWVWTAVGEGGDTVGRTAVIDDGNYHYCLSLQADATRTGELEGQWNEIFASFRVG